MTLTRPKISEREIAAAVVKYLEAQGLKVRQEVPINHPMLGDVSIDIVACLAEPDGETFTIVECKRKLNAELESDAYRWTNWAERIYYGHGGPCSSRKAFQDRLSRLTRCGFGRFYLDEELYVGHGKPLEVVPSLRAILAAAFHSHDGSHDPAAGSAAAKRMTESRAQWEPLRKYLKENGTWDGADIDVDDCVIERGIRWSEIRHCVPEMRKHTSAKCVKAIDNGECVGVRYDDESPRNFYATEQHP